MPPSDHQEYRVAVPRPLALACRYRRCAGERLARCVRVVPLIYLLDPPYAFGAEPVEELLQSAARAGTAGGALPCLSMPQPMQVLIRLVLRPCEKRYGITSVDLLRWVGKDENDHADERK